jgi:hypothetical protein
VRAATTPIAPTADYVLVIAGCRGFAARHNMRRQPDGRAVMVRSVRAGVQCQHGPSAGVPSGSIGLLSADLARLGAVDLVADDPTAAAQARPVAARRAERARTARRDADARPLPPTRGSSSAPTSSTVPTASWPRLRPSGQGHVTFRKSRSVPQIVTASHSRGRMGVGLDRRCRHRLPTSRGPARDTRLLAWLLPRG